MFGTALAWLFLVLMGLLLTKLALKNPDLHPAQRKNGFILGGVLIVFFLAVSLFSLLAAADAAPYKQGEPLESAQHLNPDGVTWALLKGRILDTGEFADLEERYSAYIEYSSSMNSREFRYANVSRDFEIELKDGTVIEFHKFVPNYVFSKWHSEGNFVFIKPGDEIVVLGTTFPVKSEKPSDPTFTLGDLEFIHLEDSVKFGDSNLRKMGIAKGIINLVVALLCILSALYFAGQLYARRKRPEQPLEP